MPLDLTRLRRHPDVEHPSLLAVDAADRLILAEAAPLLREGAADRGDVVVLDDAYGALTLSLLADDAEGPGSGLRGHQDSVVGQAALAANAAAAGIELPGGLGLDRYDAGADLLEGARLVLLRLPRSLAALTETAEIIAAHARADVHVVAGGRDKHMTPAMNDVLARYFTTVWASRGRQKSRVLHAAGVAKTGVAPTFPRATRIAIAGSSGAASGAGGGDAGGGGAGDAGGAVANELQVRAHGAAFAGAALDPGTRALLAHLPQMAHGARSAIDLGCGTGILAAALAVTRPQLQVLARDASSAAAASARATALANGVAERVRVERGDGLSGIAPASVDLIVCNPPFHSGAAVLPDVGLRMLRGSRRVLRSGGELWCVFNSRLSRARELRRLVGPTEVVADDGRFTVTRTRVAASDRGRGEERG